MINLQCSKERRKTENGERCDGEPQKNDNERGVEIITQTDATTSILHSGSNALISYEIINHIEQQVRATVASHFEELQTKMNKNVEEKLKQLLEGLRKSKKPKKLKGTI